MTSHSIASWRRLLAALAIALSCYAPARAINIIIDYQYDNGFFPVGSQARAAMNAAAAFYSGILQDTFSAITAPAPFVGGSGSVATWSWTMGFFNPSMPGQPVTLPNLAIAADEYRVFVGASDLATNVLGVGGAAGNAAWARDETPPGFTAAERIQIDQINASFLSALHRRGETSGFAAWGGTITFDSVGTNWNFNHLTAPAAGTQDFYSVALHELAHALGFGGPGDWANLASGSAFAGSNAAMSYGSPPPLEGINPMTGRRSHWATGTMSRVYGTNTAQEALMDPQIGAGTRKLVTSLDAAALKDIGWEISEPAPPLFLPADFNHDGTVNGPDLATWRNAFRTTTAGNADGDGDSDGNDFLLWQRTLGAHSAGVVSGSVPEPGSVTLAVVSALCVTTVHRRRVRATR